MQKNIDYDRITSLMVEGMENILYGSDSKDTEEHKETSEEAMLNIKKAEAIAELGKAAMDIRRTQIEEKRLNLEVVKTLLKDGSYTVDDLVKKGFEPGILALENKTEKEK